MTDTKGTVTKKKLEPKKWEDLTTGEKITGSIISGAIVLGILAYLIYAFFFFDNTHNSKPKQTQAVASQTQQSNEQQAPAKPLTPEQQLKQAATNAIGKDKVRSVDVEPQVDGGYGVFVEYNADDNLNTGMIKKGIEKAMSDVYIALYHDSSQDVRQASVAAYMPLEDQYGNTNDGVVYKSVLRKDVAAKINYSQEKAVLELNIVPKLWTTTLLNASFR